MIDLTKGAQRRIGDFALNRSCYLIAQNGDPRQKARNRLCADVFRRTDLPAGRFRSALYVRRGDFDRQRFMGFRFIRLQLFQMYPAGKHQVIAGQ